MWMTGSARGAKTSARKADCDLDPGGPADREEQDHASPGRRGEALAKTTRWRSPRNFRIQWFEARDPVGEDAASPIDRAASRGRRTHVEDETELLGPRRSLLAGSRSAITVWVRVCREIPKRACSRSRGRRAGSRISVAFRMSVITCRGGRFSRRARIVADRLRRCSSSGRHGRGSRARKRPEVRGRSQRKTAGAGGRRDGRRRESGIAWARSAEVTFADGSTGLVKAGRHRQRGQLRDSSVVCEPQQRESTSGRQCGGWAAATSA